MFPKSFASTLNELPLMKISRKLHTDFNLINTKSLHNLNYFFPLRFWRFISHCFLFYCQRLTEPQTNTLTFDFNSLFVVDEKNSFFFQWLFVRIENILICKFIIIFIILYQLSFLVCHAFYKNSYFCLFDILRLEY